jgi:hypothetical protein
MVQEKVRLSLVIVVRGKNFDIDGVRGHCQPMVRGPLGTGCPSHLPEEM